MLRQHDFEESDPNDGHLLATLKFSCGSKVSLQFDRLSDEIKFVGDTAADEPGASRTLIDETSHINLLAQTWLEGY